MVGREKEKGELLSAYESVYSEFVAVYGRGRIGKTFLIRETFDYKFAFQHSGIKNGGRSVQLSRFRKSIVQSGYAECPELKDWFSAFDALRTVIDRAQIAELYMVLGGVPYYWQYLRKGDSVAQNVDALFFAGNDKLENEFDGVFGSLFASPRPYLSIITALGRKKAGMTRDELAKNAGVANNGVLTRRLLELEQYFFKDYLAYQPEYSDKIRLMCRMMRENGYEFMLMQDIVD